MTGFQYVTNSLKDFNGTEKRIINFSYELVIKNIVVKFYWYYYGIYSYGDI